MKFIFRPFFAFEYRIEPGFVVLWRYIAISWLTAVYHGRVYGYEEVQTAAPGVYGSFFWPAYWFVESVRWIT